MVQEFLFANRGVHFGFKVAIQLDRRSVVWSNIGNVWRSEVGDMLPEMDAEDQREDRKNESGKMTQIITA